MAPCLLSALTHKREHIADRESGKITSEAPESKSGRVFRSGIQSWLSNERDLSVKTKVSTFWSEEQKFLLLYSAHVL